MWFNALKSSFLPDGLSKSATIQKVTEEITSSSESFKQYKLILKIKAKTGTFPVNKIHKIIVFKMNHFENKKVLVKIKHTQTEIHRKC